MSFTYFPAARLLELAMLCLDHGLASRRRELVTGIPNRWVALVTLPGADEAAQLRRDLDELNRSRTFQGQVLFIIWLDNALRLVLNDDLQAALHQVRLEVSNRLSGAVPPPPAAGATIPQAIVHRDDRLPYRFLERGFEAGRSVARVRVARVDGVERPKAVLYDGTGWLVAPGVLMTNHHVVQARDPGDALPSEAQLARQAAEAEIAFGLDADGVRGQRVKVKKLLVADVSLDYALLELEVSEPLPGPLQLSRSPITLGHNSVLSLNIIQHPLGEAKRIAVRNNLACRVDATSVDYFTDTDHGSSGSPVFNDDWQVVALHRAARQVVKINFQGRPTAVVNVGVPIVAILEDLRQHHPTIYTRLFPEERMERDLFPQWASLSSAEFRTRLWLSLPLEGLGEGRRRLLRALTPQQLAQLEPRPNARVEELKELELEVELQEGDARWWLEALSPGFRSLSFRTRSAPARRGWDWPLDVAVHGGSDHWARGLSLSHLRREATLESQTLIELLLVPTSLETVCPPALLPRIHTVVVLGGGNEGRVVERLDALRGQWRADAAILLALEASLWPKWLEAITAHLSHDLPLDVAIAFTARELQVSMPLCLGRPEAFSRARLSTLARSVLSHHGGRLGSPALKFLDRIKADPEATFLGESHGATEFAAMRAELDAVPENAATDRARWVCAELKGQPRPGERVPIAVQIRVAQADERTAVADSPLPVPEDWVAGEAHRLVVLFQDLTAPFETRDDVQSRSLHLPAAGPSSIAEFSLLVPPDRDFVARLIVLEYPARVLQTLTYRLSGPKRTPSLLEETEARSIESLGGPRSDVTVSFVLNHDANEKHLLTAIQEGRATVVDGSQYTKALTLFGTELDRLADGQGQQPPYAPKSENLQLLINLAKVGANLRGQLEFFAQLPPLAQVQVVSIDPNQVLPVELCYDGRAPADTATICTRSLELMREGAKSCECDPKNDQVVCPLRFWGTSRIIERHARAPRGVVGGVRLLPDYEGPTSRRVSLEGPPLWVMHADTGSAQERARLRKDLTNEVPQQVLISADTWKDWRAVMQRKPAVIAAALHHDDNGIGSYELANESLQLVEVDDQYVGEAPIVIFLGCTTAGSSLSPFTPASNFLMYGATVVVGTYSKTVGRFAALAARTLVGALYASKDQVRVAEVLRRVRGILLCNGITTALSMVALGDADCVIDSAAPPRKRRARSTSSAPKGP